MNKSEADLAPKLKQIIGEFVFQIASLQTQLEIANEMLMQKAKQDIKDINEEKDVTVR